MNASQQLQLDVYGRLSAATYFSDISVYLVRPRSKSEALLLQTKIDNALAGLEKKNGKSGVAVRVEMPFFEVPGSDRELPGPYGERVVTVRVIENPLINMSDLGTGKSAEDIYDAVLSELHDFAPRPYDILYADRRAAEPVEELVKEGKVAYDVSVRQKGGTNPPPKAAQPTIAQVVSNVTLASTTSGAAIYYTVAGGDDPGGLASSYPWPENPAAILYSAPFAVTVGDQIRAVAYATGYHASDVLAAEITA